MHWTKAVFHGKLLYIGKRLCQARIYLIQVIALNLEAGELLKGVMPFEEPIKKGRHQHGALPES